MRRLTKKRWKSFGSSVLAVLIVAAMVLEIIPQGFVPRLETYAAEAAVADGNTMTSWESAIKDSTQHVGRIWTDKSVFTEDVTISSAHAGESDFVVEKGDSDFLVALSALSSTSNLTTYSAIPLDIVLVLDTSGSMADPMVAAGYRYTEVYADDLQTGSTYYIPDGRGYREVSYDSDRQEWGYYTGFIFAKWNPVTPKTGADDTTGTQFYSREYQAAGPSKLSSLQTAVNGFIDATAEANAGVDAEKQHQLSIVTYASESSVRRGLGTVTEATKERYHYTVDNLRANGATRADLGMGSARQELEDNGREAAQKVVIFFTDGEPTTSSSFSTSVANAAVNTAHQLKNKENDEAWIYSIGIFEGADVTGTDRNNNFMNAVSSNYPQAKAYDELGNRVSEDAAYYKTADNAEDLNAVFEEIFEDMQPGNVPTQVEGGDPSEGGYITFTDTLGDYMTADGFKEIIFAERSFKNVETTTSDNTDTYTFRGKVEAGDGVYQNGDLSDIVIKVEKADSLKTGDTVTVQIPASLIPLRKFNVEETDNGVTTSVTDAYPMRIFFGVSMKEGVEEKIANPDADMERYIAENTGADGKLNFYSNAFTKGERAGDTTAVFTPADTNSFYYFGEEKQLFLDEECSRPAINTWEDTYYYQRTYYEVGKSEPSTEVVELSSALDADGFGLVMFEAYRNREDGGIYIPALAKRHMSVNNLHTEKKDNSTGTAVDVINPQWTGDVVTTYLGNNGRMQLDLPGTLEVSKTVEAAEGHTVPEKFAGQEFAFEAALTAPEGKELAESYAAQKMTANDNGEPTVEDVTLTVTDGKVEFTLKNNETIRIYGLEAGVSYTVKELDVPEQFTGSLTADGAKGTIESSQTAQVAVTNTYEAKETVVSDTLKAEKSFVTASGDSAWNKVAEGQTFEFILQAVSVNAPMPEGSAESNGRTEYSLKVTDGTAQTYPEITYTEPGVFEYNIYERIPVSNKTPGVSYSDELYRVTVTVTDENGELRAETAMIKVRDFAGNPIANGGEPAKTAEFQNVFNPDKGSATLLAAKTYQNTVTGEDMELTNNLFRFQMTPVTENAPMPNGAVEAEGKKIAYTGNEGANVWFEKIDITEADLTNGQGTWVYEISEVIPEVAVDNVLNGTTYDPTVYYAKLTARVEDEKIVAEVAYFMDEECNQPVPEENLGTQGRVLFENTYTAEAVSTTIEATKTLTGRGLLEDETFTFTLEGANDAAKEVLENTPQTAIVNKLDEKGMAKFGFGIRFTEAGWYRFTVKETAGDKAGLTYDDEVYTVIVHVTDNGQGALEAASTTYRKASGGTADRADFVNEYHAEMTYGGLDVSKTLTGRNMQAGEFTFTIAPQEGTPELPDADASFVNGASAEGRAHTMEKLTGLSLTEEDAGKTYTYIVDEADKADENGLTNDKSQYKVEIAVEDNGDGTLHTATTVTRIMSADGTEVSELIGTYDSASDKKAAVSFTNAYAAAPAQVDISDEFIKIISGRGWQENDSFTFDMEAWTEGAPMPESAKVTVDYDKAEEQNATAEDAEVQFGFGSITFTEPGTYQYLIREENGGETHNGLVYSDEVAGLTIKVTDGGNGQLTAETKVVAGTFINVYRADMDYTAAGGIRVYKTLNGPAGLTQEFKFTATASDEATAEKFGLTTEGVTSDPIEVTSGGKTEVFRFRDMIFDQSDIGKTYGFTISEVDDKKAGYTYDTTVYEVEIAISDAGSGKLQAVTKVNDEVKATWTSDTAEADPVALEFTNSYSASGGEVAVQATKELAGRPLKADEFSFDLMTKGRTDGEIAVAEDKINAADGTVDFGTLTYTTEALETAVGEGYAQYDAQTKTYTVRYEAVEDTTDLPGGVSATTERIDVTVTVVDNGDGTLTADVAYGNGGKLVNKYEPNETTLPGATYLNVTKNFTGRENNAWLEADEFTFTLAAGDDTTKQAVEAGNVVLPNETALTIGAADEVKEKAFGNITFKTAGTYVFTVTENVPEDTKGITYDAAPRTVMVNVMDNGDGTLTAAVVGEGGSLTFTNEYETGETTLNGAANLEVTKVFTGRENDAWLDTDEFTFTLALAETQEDETVDAGNVVLSNAQITIDDEDEDKKAAFGDITFKAAGTYVFTVAETVPEDTKGITYDAAPRTVTVNVTDNGDGTLTAAVAEGSDDLTFTNTYAAEEVQSETDGDLTVTKELVGRDWQDGDEFTFTLTPDAATQTAIENGAVEVPETRVTIGKDSADHQATFRAITFKKAGDYKFTVAETKGNIEGITYDDHTAEVTYHVYDNGEGELVIGTKTREIAGSMTFANVYDPGTVSATLVGEKQMSGRELKAEDKFGFTIRALTENAPMPGLATVENNGEDISFGTIVFDPVLDEETNAYPAQSVYEYEITENDTEIPGVTKDGEAVKVKVTVNYDKATGALTSGVEYTKGETVTNDKFTFVNTYQASPADPVSFHAVKAVAPSEGNSYEMKGGEFTFELVPSDANPQSDPVAEKNVTNDAQGNVKLAENAVYTEPGVYEYAVREVSGSLGGMSYDDAVYGIRVTVTNEEGTLGQLKASVEITKTEADKTEAVDGITFTNNYNPAETSAALGGTKVLTGKALEDGEFTFKLDGVSAQASVDTEEEAEKPEVPETEEKEEDAQAQEDESSDGAADAEKEAEALGEETKAQSPEAEAPENAEEDGAAEKAKAEAAVSEQEKKPEAKTEDIAAPMPEAGADTATNTAAGVFSFGSIKFTRPGVYVYRISEVNDGREGYTYDAAAYEVTVTVTDENGELKAEVAGMDAVVFNNSYKPTPVTVAEGAIKGHKTLEGRELKAEEFAFELLDADGNVVSEAKNAADGTFAFGEMTFDEVGTYYYTIVEADTKLGGVTYDTAVYTAKVDVKDAGGHLEAETSIMKDDAVVEAAEFKNTYKAEPTEVMLGAAKILEGRKLKAGEFKFVVKDGSGNVVAEAANNADGTVAFEKLTFDKAGEYKYTVSEVAGSDKTMTYDKTVYDVTVIVTDSGEGYLQVSVQYGQGAPVFTNKYTEPKPEPKPEEPKPPQPTQPDTTVATGDTAMAAPMTMTALGMMMLAMIIFIRRKNAGRN